MVGGRRLATYYGARLGAGLVSLAFIPMATRVGGAEAYGEYAAVIASGLLVSGVATTWMRQYLLRRSGTEVPDVVGSTMIVRLLQLIAVPIATFMLCLLVAPAKSAIAGAVAAAAMSFFSLTSGTLEAAGRTSGFALAEVLRGVFSVAMLAMLILLGWMANAPALVTIIGLGYWAAVVLGRRMVDRSALVPLGPENLRRAWAFGWPLSLWVGFSLLLQYADRAMIIRFSGLEDAGTYAASYDLVLRAVGFGLLPITHAVHVTFAERWNSGKRASAMAVRKKAILLQVVLTVTALVLAIALHQIVDVGETISGLLAVPDVTLGLLLLLISGQAIWNMGLLLHKQLEFSGRTGLLATSAGAMAMTNIGLNRVWIPQYGNSGAATATLVTAVGYILLVEFATRSSLVPKADL